MSSARSYFVLIFAAFVALGLSPAAAETDYPNRPIRIIAPFGAGGPGDVFSRQLAQYLPQVLKQAVVVEDRPGAASIIGTDAVAKSAPDGYTLLTVSNTLTTNETLFPNRPYVLMRDLVPVADAQLFRTRDGDPSLSACEEPDRVHCLREIETCSAELRFSRRRHPLSYGR